MNVDSKVVEQLRKMFLKGATPFRLIAFIAERHADDPDWPRTVQKYFWEAFCVVMLDMENHPHDKPLDEKDFSSRNIDILHEMVRRYPLWKDDFTPDPDTAHPWCEGLEVATDELELVDGIDLQSHPALTESWPMLISKAQSFVRQAMVNASIYHERLEIVTRLLESLERRISSLEGSMIQTNQSDF